MSSSVEQIKERLDIATVVGGYIKLEKAGGNFRARCPFHNEKTPSFMVSPDRGTYHCFGCNRGGDIFSFVEEIEGTDFRGALRILADKAGVVLTAENPKERNEKDRLFALLADATLFYRKELRKNKDALSYLQKRGLTGETIDTFEIGFAPAEWHALEEYLLSKGYKPDEMEKTGMSIRSEKVGQEGRHYDRFRSRIMFPLTDSSGRVVGFSGRIFNSDDPAKYVNSPETPLYNKSKILFGLSLAKAHIREAGSVIMVEGQMDLVMAHQAGTKNSVAVSGTALTNFHLETLKRFAEKILFAFDSDDAGISAAKRSAIPALMCGFDVLAIDLSGEKDPADLILENPEKWITAVSKAKHIVEFFLSTLEKRSPDKRIFRLNVEKNVLPIIASIESKIDQSHFIGVVATFLDIPRDAVAEEVQKAGRGMTFERLPGGSENSVPIPEKKSTPTRKEMIERKIYGVYHWQKSMENPAVSPDELSAKLEEFVGEIRMFNDSEKNALIFEAEAFYGGSASIRDAIQELLQNLEREAIIEALTETKKELQKAELLHDGDKIAVLLEKMKVLMGRYNKNQKTL